MLLAVINLHACCPLFRCLCVRVFGYNVKLLGPATHFVVVGTFRSLYIILYIKFLTTLHIWILAPDSLQYRPGMQLMSPGIMMGVWNGNILEQILLIFYLRWLYFLSSLVHNLSYIVSVYMLEPFSVCTLTVGDNIKSLKKKGDNIT